MKEKCIWPKRLAFSFLIGMIILSLSSCGEVENPDAVSETEKITSVTANQTPTVSSISDQTIVEDATSDSIAFTIGDSETLAKDLTVSVASSETTLVPVDNIVVGGTTENRTVTVTPVENQSGSSTITITVSDGEDSATSSFAVAVTNVNDSPTISSIAAQSINEDFPTSALNFSVSDVETTVSSLTVAGISSNTTLVPNSNIVISGSDADKTVTITPVANENGTATITLSVSDGDASSDTSLELTVNAVNDTPTITTIGTQYVNTSVAITVTAADVDTSTLTFSATSSDNSTLFPDSNIVFSGSGTSRTLTISPATSQTGTGSIKVSVYDGNSTATETFSLITNPCESQASGSLLNASIFSTNSTCGQTNNDVIIKDGHIVEWDVIATGESLFTGTIKIKSGGKLQCKEDGGTIFGNVELNGGTLEIQGNTTISGNITHTESSTVNISSGKRLIYSGDALNIGENTLTLNGTGSIHNSAESINLNTTDSVLNVAATGTGSVIEGEVRLAGGTLDIDASMTIGGIITHPASSKINVAADKTLSLTDVHEIAVGGYTLTLEGDGEIDNTSAISLNDSNNVADPDDLFSVLKIEVGSSLIVRGIISLGGGVLDVDENFTVQNMTHSANTKIDIASGKILTYSGTPIPITANTLQLDGTGIFGGGINLSGGTLEVLGDVTLTGSLGLTASSALSIANTKALKYSAITDVAIGDGITLTMSGRGTFNNNNSNIVLNSANSILKLDGDGGTINAVNVSGADIANDKGIDVNEDYTITTLTQGANDLKIAINALKTLTLTNAYEVPTTETLTITEMGTLKTAGGLTTGATSILTVGTGTLDVTGSILTPNTLTLNADLNTAGGGTLTTSNTNLTLGTTNVILTTGQTINIQTLSLLNHTLQLGLDTPGLTVAEIIEDWDNANEKIVTNNANLTITAALNMSAGSITSSSGIITLGSTGTISGGGFFNVPGSSLVLGGDFSTVGAGLETNPSTNLTLTATAELTSDDAITLNSLNLGGFQLTLGSDESDLSVQGTITNGPTSTEKNIITQGANLSLTLALSMTGGEITSTEGDITLTGGGTISGGVFSVSGGTLSLGGDLDTTGATLTTDDTDPYTTHLTLSENVTLTSGQPITVGDLALVDYQLTLGSDTTDLWVTGAIAFSFNAAGEKIITQDADLTLTAALAMTNGAITSSSGVITLTNGGAVSDDGILNVSGNLVTSGTTTLKLGGNLNTTGGTLTTNSLTNLTLTSPLTLTSDETVTIKALVLGGNLLTLGDTTPLVTVLIR